VDRVAGLLPKHQALLVVLHKNDLVQSAALAGDLAVAMRELQRELLGRALALPPILLSDDGVSIDGQGGTPRSAADAFPELSARLQEIIEALETHADELKGTQRQALVAERIKLANELESRHNAAYLTRLLTGNTLQRLVEALFAPEQGSSAAAAKRTRMQKMASEVELLVNAKQGRKHLASTIRDYAARTGTIGPQGFECICTLLSECMGAMVSEAAPVFDELVVCKTEAFGQPPQVCGHLDWRAIGQDGSAAEPPMGIESLCMPTSRSVASTNRDLKVDRAAASSTEGSASIDSSGAIDDGSAGPEGGSKQQTTTEQEGNQYVIIRTLEDGTRQYGFCAPLQSADEEVGGARVLCVLSRHPWFQLFQCVLDALVSAAASEQPQDGVPAVVVSILDALWHVTKSAFPMPGERFTVPFDLALAVDKGREPLHLTRARDDEALLRDAEFAPLFKCMGVSGVLAIYSALLAERHVLFVSSSYVRLCSCIHASMAMIYPFVWQHILVAILPESWIDYVTAPMPFVLGIDDSLLERVLELPIEESLLIVKIDTGEIAEVVSAASSPAMATEDAAAETGAVCAPVPASLSCRLEKSLSKMTNDLRKQRLEPSEFNRSVLDEFVGGMAQLFSDYREYLGSDADDADAEDGLVQGNERRSGQAEQFDMDGLIASFDGDVDTQAFLNSLRRTQLFDRWCQERFALKAQGFSAQGQGLFEAKISEQDSRASDESAARAQSVDVETASYIVDASLTLQCLQTTQTPVDDLDSGAPLLLLDRVRQHELWKNSSLWQRIFEETLAAEANLELLTLNAAATRAISAAPVRTKRPTLGRRASVSVMLGRMGGTVSEDVAAQQAAIAAAQEASEAQADAHAKALKREAGKLSEKIVQHSETMMRFGLPLDLVERLSTKLAESHQLNAERVEKDVKLKVVSLIPKFVHLQPITKEGWLEVERATSSTTDGWDVRWFRIRDTSLCIHESDTHAQPSSVFPCAACEVSEPKSKRKGKEHVFRINVESHAVSAQDADSGSASKHVALKLIVNASSAEEKTEWYKHLQFGGAFVPTIERHTLRGDAKTEAVEALASMSAVSMKIRSGADHAVHAAAAKAAKAGAKAKPAGVAAASDGREVDSAAGGSDGGADNDTTSTPASESAACGNGGGVSGKPEIRHSGMLEKKGARARDGFKRRWFELVGTTLAYYDKQDGKHKGDIDVTAAADVNAVEGSKSDLVVLMKAGKSGKDGKPEKEGRTYHLRAADSKRRDEWVEHIQAALQCD
jgi:hypothetical protein